MPTRRTGGKANDKVGKTSLGKAIQNDHRKRNEFLPEIRAEKATGVSQIQAQRSVLEQSSLDDFLAQAALSSAVFPAERQRWGDPVQDTGCRLVGTVPEGGEAEADAASNRVQLAATRIVVPIPWRPLWQHTGSAQELATAEGEAFLDWRRDLALLEAKEHVVMTPYERNLDFWRQLWRCVERSDLLVQIVDARDPYFYRSRDLERYVRERFPAKRHMILMNKSDFLSPALRRRWAAHFLVVGVEVIFFSALRELHRQHRITGSSSRWDPSAGTRGSSRIKEEEDKDVAEEEGEEKEAANGVGEAGAEESSAGATAAEPPLPPHGAFFDADDPDVLDCAQLMDEIRARLPPAEAGEQGEGAAGGGRRGVVGFVGYPNVGKSSVINALFGAKKVSMSRTPGKTKHLQTLDLPGTDLTLCDCPGLVFPSVVATRAHLAINGTVPLVELRDAVQPLRLIVDKIGADKVAEKYELSEAVLKDGEKRLGTAVDPARRILAGYALERKKFLGLGVPDETWAARKILHDYCTGVLLHCEEPPALEVPAASATSSAVPPALAATAAAGPVVVMPVQEAAKAAPGEGGSKAVAKEEDDDSDFSDLDAFLKGEVASGPSGPRMKGGSGQAKAAARRKRRED